MRQYCTLQQLQCQPSQLIIVHVINQSFANFFSHSLVCSVLILVPGFNIMRPNEQTQPSSAKLVSVILFARASKQFTIQTSVIYQKENYSYVLKFHDIFEFFIMIFTGLARLLKTQNKRCRQFALAPSSTCYLLQNKRFY